MNKYQTGDCVDEIRQLIEDLALSASDSGMDSFTARTENCLLGPEYVALASGNSM